jgi:methyl-accepting chemotaxis protein
MAARTLQFRRTFLIAGAGIAFVIVLIIGLLVRQTAQHTLQQLADRRGQELAGRVAALASVYVRERHHETDALATNPAVIAAAIQASQTATQDGLDQADIPTLERRFAGARALGGPPELQRYFRDYTSRSDLAEVFFTERHGYTVLGSERTSDFVQSDEEWWQAAVREGSYDGEPEYDSSANVVAVEYDVAIRPAAGARPVGVIKAVFSLEHLSELVTGGSLGDSAYLQIVDDHGHLLLAQDKSLLLQTAPQAASITRDDRIEVAHVATPHGEELVVSAPANAGRWWVLFRQPTTAAYATARATSSGVLLGLFGLYLVVVAIIFGATQWLERRVTAPVRAAGALTGRIAAGDLTATIAFGREEAGEVGELMSGVQTMVVALRRLVGAIRSAADEAAAMASEIAASTQQMSASTQEMTATTQDLTRRAADQAQTVRAAADDSERILQIATILATGADDSVRRNASLAGLAKHHKQLLDQSTAQLAKLAEEIERGAQEAEALTKASSDIQKFVGQTKAVATQTNMLALNAAIEAARAGQQGRGFAVVADEVRKLASVAAAAATETAETVRGVLGRLQTTRDRLQRLAQTGAVAREAAQTASQGLATVASEAEAGDAWSKEIASSASEVRRLIEEISGRLNLVSQGTEGLVASAEEIAASSQQQSASTAEIASSANQLAEAADKLTGAVKTFRLVPDQPPAPDAPASPPAPTPAPTPAGTPLAATS